MLRGTRAGFLHAASLLPFLFFSPALAQQSNARIEGTLWVENGSPDGTRISMQNSSGQVLGEAYANSDGRFSFREVYADQDYFLVVKKEGHIPLREEVDLHVLGSNPHVNLFLRRAVEPRDKGTGGNLVSAAELNLPKKARKLHDEAVEEMARGDNTSAIASLERVLEMAPDFFPAEDELGVAYFRTGKLERARQSFEGSIRHNANFATAHVHLGMTLNMLHQFREAEQALEKGLALEANSWAGNYHLAAAALALGNDTKAEACLKKALLVARDQHPETHIALANLYVKTARYQLAADELSAYLKAAPAGPLAPRAKQVLEDMKAKGAAR